MKISPRLFYLSHYPRAMTSAALSCCRASLVMTEHIGQISCLVDGPSRLWVEKPWHGL